MMRVARFGMKSVGLAVALAAIAPSIAACGGPTTTEKDPVLVADPPLDDATSAKGSPAGSELQRGMMFVESEKFPEAKEHLTKALELEPRNTQAMFYLAIVDEGLDDPAAAEGLYKNALKIDPKFTDAAQNLAALYLRDPARPDEAIKLLSDMLKQAPGDVGLLQNLAYAYVLKKDNDNAGKTYEALLKTKGGDTPQNRIDYASFLLETKQRDKAAVELKKVLAATDENPTKLVTVGRLLASAGAFGDCVTAFNRAIAAKGDDASFFMRRGMCRKELKDEAGARGDFEGALKLDPNLVAAHYQLGVSWAADKNIANARASLTKASELGKDSEVGKAARQKLAELPKK